MTSFITRDPSGLHITIPPIPETFAAVLWFGGLLLTMAFVLAFLRFWPNRASRLKPVTRRWHSCTDWLKRSYLTPLLVFGFAAILWAAYTYLWQIPGLIGDMLRLMKSTVTGDSPNKTEDIRSLAYAFAALTGTLAILATVPFQLVKVWINERTANTGENNLTTGLINTAVEGLGTNKIETYRGRQVNWTREINGKDRREGFTQRWGQQPDIKHRLPPELAGRKESELDDIISFGEWTDISETVPNLEVRVGAIFTLERIARDNPDQHIRIMDILCTYIRENAKAEDAEGHTFGRWPNYPENPTSEALKERGELLSKRFLNFNTWISGLPTPRTDIQATIEVIGRRSQERIGAEEARETRNGKTGYRLDLRKTNLRCTNLSHLDFRNALFTGARMEGAILSETRIENADLRRAWLEMANFNKANLQDAQVRGAWMERIDLSAARLDRADLREARLERAMFKEASMSGAYLSAAQMERANFSAARMEGVNLFEARMAGADFRQARMNGANFFEARMERAIFVQAHMSGADLRAVRMEGANLSGARMDGANLTAAGLEGAYLRRAQMKGVNLSRARMAGTYLKEADLRLANWEGAITGSPVHFADLRGAQGLTQEQIDQMVGNAATLLPEQLEDGTIPAILSCWETLPPQVDNMIARIVSGMFERNKTVETIRTEFLCAPGKSPQRTGIPLALNAAYPSGHPLARHPN